MRNAIIIIVSFLLLTAPEVSAHMAFLAGLVNSI